MKSEPNLRQEHFPFPVSAVSHFLCFSDLEIRVSSLALPRDPRLVVSYRREKSFLAIEGDHGEASHHEDDPAEARAAARDSAGPRAGARARDAAAAFQRSEERRVGKEGRTRWSP